MQSISWRKRPKNDRKKHFNIKLEDQIGWNDSFSYQFLCEILQVILPKITVSKPKFSTTKQALLELKTTKSFALNTFFKQLQSLFNHEVNFKFFLASI